MDGHYVWLFFSMEHDEKSKEKITRVVAKFATERDYNYISDEGFDAVLHLANEFIDAHLQEKYENYHIEMIEPHSEIKSPEELEKKLKHKKTGTDQIWDVTQETIPASSDDEA